MRNMEDELREFFLRCLEAVETDNIDSLPEDLREVADAIENDTPGEILEY